MANVIVSSMRRSAGKTSLIVGMGKALKGKMGYMKPFGDRLVYRKKRLWDYDSALITGIFGLGENPEDMSLGFDHSKLRYMYDTEGSRKKLLECVKSIGGGKQAVFIEAGADMQYGTSVHLGANSLSKYTGARLVVVISGDDNTILDDAAFLKKYTDKQKINFGGVIVNKVKDPAEFKRAYLKEIEGMGVKVFGVIPYREELTYFSVGHLVDALFAKVVTGEEHLGRKVKNILIGAMAGGVAMQKAVFRKKDKLVITGGDRSDMILAALEADAAAILLTNNILPQPDLVAKAAEKKVPLLLVPQDTFEVARRIDAAEPLLTKDDGEKIALLEKLVKENVDVKGLVGK